MRVVDDGFLLLAEYSLEPFVRVGRSTGWCEAGVYSVSLRTAERLARIQDRRQRNWGEQELAFVRAQDGTLGMGSDPAGVWRQPLHAAFPTQDELTVDVDLCAGLPEGGLDDHPLPDRYRWSGRGR